MISRIKDWWEDQMISVGPSGCFTILVLFFIFLFIEDFLYSSFPRFFFYGIPLIPLIVFHSYLIQKLSFSGSLWILGINWVNYFYSEDYLKIYFKEQYIPGYGFDKVIGIYYEWSMVILTIITCAFLAWIIMVDTIKHKN